MTKWLLALVAALPLGAQAQDVTLPWTADFENDEFTILNEDDDYDEWDIDDDMASIGTFLLDDGVRHDDWLITPSFQLEAGKTYQFTINVATFGEGFPESLEAFVGDDATAAAMTNEVIAEKEIDSDDPQVLTGKFTPTTSGIYYFGIHCTSGEEAYELDVTGITIEEAAVAAAPSPVTDLTVTPGEGGALQATVSFKAPTTKLDESELSAIESIKVFRDNGTEAVKVFDNPTPGEECSFTDTGLTDGDYIYKVVAYDAETGAGEPATATAFVGVDLPKAPTNVQVKVEGDDVIISWDRASETGWNGKYVNPDEMEYTIYEYHDAINRTIAAENVSGQSCTLTGRASEDVNQSEVGYRVQANNRRGNSSTSGGTTIVVGKAYTLPFAESFANGQVSYMWFVDSSKSTAKYEKPTESQDGDNGALLLKTTAANDTISFRSGKVAVKGANEPKLLFYSRLATGKDTQLKVNVVKDNAYLYTKEIAASDNWTEQIIDLSEFANLDYVQIYFNGYFKTDCADIFIDNITLKEAATDGISTLQADQTPFTIYDLNGRRLPALQHGINIVRMADGSTKKIKN